MTLGRSGLRSTVAGAAVLGLVLVASCAREPGAGLQAVRARKALRWGADQEGGGPYIFPSPDDPSRVVGFEVDLMSALSRGLHVRSEFRQAEWTLLPRVLRLGHIDVIANGYELTTAHLADKIATIPYYVYELRILVRADDDRVRDWGDLRGKRVGVLSGSSAEKTVRRSTGAEIVGFDGVTQALDKVLDGDLDASVQDFPAWVHLSPSYPRIRATGPPAGRGYYVLYLRPGDEALRDALDEGIRGLIARGELRRIYDRYRRRADQAVQHLVELEPRRGSAAGRPDGGLVPGDEHPAGTGGSSPRAAQGGGARVIEVESIVKHHGAARVLDGVSLRVDKGEVAAVVGPSGGGKSTLLRCINGLEAFESGAVRVGDITLGPGDAERPGGGERLRALRRRIGMVFQEFHLFPHLTVLDNVTAGPRWGLGRPRAEAESEARRLLERVGLAEKALARPDDLSGGQKQRVAIARALAVQPEAVLFDEPTSALDPRMAAEVLAVIADLARSGQTMIVVTHAMGFARRVAHTVHVMNEGRVAESGPAAEVFAAPKTDVTRHFLQEVSD